MRTKGISFWIRAAKGIMGRSERGFRKQGAVLALAGFLCVLPSSPQFGQSVPTVAPSGQQTPVPLPHLYWHFLMHQNHLDRVAAQREKEGKDGTWLRNYYQQKMRLTDPQFAPVRETAVRLEAELNEIDAKVKAIIDAAHARYPRALKSPKDLPPVPPELYALRDEHEAVIAREVGGLKSALGPDRSAKLEAFLQHDFAPNVTVHLVAHPQRRDLTKRRSSSRPKAVQQ